MDTTSILNQLKQEQTRLDVAIAALEALGGSATPKLGRPKGGTSFEFGANKPTGRGRQLSAAGRARIAAAAKARWAKVKAAKAAKPAKAGRRISAAGRRRIAEAAKKMWAQRRKGKTAAQKTASAGGWKMSPAARKRIAEAMRKRWAARKKAAKAAV